MSASSAAGKAGRAAARTSKQAPGTAFSGGGRPDALARYREKRDFDRTPEPAGVEDAPATRPAAAPARYVIQKHWARRLHYDFRLEIEGTMKSWAVPKGPSLDPSVKRMAVHVEDHPIAYNDFEGTIPSGQYGAGKVIVWDRGHWTTEDDPGEAYRSGKLSFELAGAKLQGRWALVRMGGRGNGGDGKQDAWLLIKEKDAHARLQSEFDVTEALPDSVASSRPLRRKHRRDDAGSGGTVTGAEAGEGRKADEGLEAGGSGRGSAPGEGRARARSAAARPRPPSTALPETLAPQLATRVSAAPAAGDWLYELKYDGYRILTRMSTGRARLHTRRGHDWTGRLRALARAFEAEALPDGWYDGEIVVLAPDGRPDFQALQNALEPDSGSGPRSRNGKAAGPDGAGNREITCFLFDLPWLRGDDLRRLPLDERRAVLADILDSASHPALRLSAAFDAPARDMLRSACGLGLEGIIGKRRSSPYVSGRSGHWIKLKCGERQEFVVGGYTDPKGARAGLGALLLGYYDDDGELRYAGKVGSGFSDESLAVLHRRLRALHRQKPPFADPPREAHVHWVQPRLAAEVSFSQWTGSGRIRHAVFQGLRDDKPTTLMKKEYARTITHPERIVDARSGARKADVAAYYERIAPLLMPHLENRPVSMLRAPEGIEGELFFQKHMAAGGLQGLMQLDPALDPGHDPLVVVSQAAGLAEAAQLNVIEFHTWNALRDRIDRPDRISFDLDPGQGVPWPAMQEAAVLLRSFLQELELASFAKTSGGKGLHVIVPIVRRYDWDTVKGFSRAVVQHMAEVLPRRFSAKSGPRNRVGKIFIDYLRNGFGATTVAAWSLRARPGMGVSVPIAWEEVETLEGGDHWKLANVDTRLETGNQPWAEYGKSASTLGPAMKRLGYER